MTIVVAAAVAALLGAAGPAVIARLPEPAEAEKGKLTYAELACAPYLAAWLAAGAAVLATLAAWRVPVELLPVWVLFAGAGSWLAYVDWRTRLLPFLLVAPLYAGSWLLAGLGALLLDDAGVLLKALIGNIVVFAVFWLIHLIGLRFGNAFGYGDVRLSAVLGVALGALGSAATITGAYAGFVLGAIGGLLTSRLGWVDRQGFAFGPYMVVGAIVGAVWGSPVWPG